jgi:hypothetical protein
MDSPGIVCPNGHPVATTSPNLQFCTTCGERLEGRCPSGHPVPPSARFCRECGAAVTATASDDRRPATEPAASTSTATTPTPAPLRPPPRAEQPVASGTSTASTQPVAPIHVGDPARPAHTQAPPAVAPPTVAWSPSGDSSKSTRPRRLALGAAVGVVLIGAAVGVTYFLMAKSPKASPAAGGHTPVSHPVKRSSSANPTEGHTVNSVPTTTTTTGPSNEQAAATSLSGLLGQSVADRSSINSASEDVAACGPGLATDSETFQAAATSRQQLLSSLPTLPDESALPSQLIQTLTNAWEASEQVDEDYAGWASTENSGGCSPGGTSNPYFQAAETPNNQATDYKQNVANIWNPIAQTYHLPTYQWNQL